MFLSVHRGIRKFDAGRPGATFRGWLWTIARNAIVQWLRRSEPQPAGGSTALARFADVPEPFDESLRDDAPSTTDEAAALLRRALDQIRPGVEPQTWDAFWHTAVLGRAAPEVAEDLGLTPAAVRQAKSRMLRRLRRQLGDR